MRPQGGWGRLQVEVGMTDGQPGFELGCLTKADAGQAACQQRRGQDVRNSMLESHLLSSLYVTNLTAELGTIRMQLVPFPLNHSLNPPVLVMCINPWMWPSQM